MTKDENKPAQKQQTPGTKKVFDVMRPGKALASPTSRPVISTHKAKIKDDMFVPSADSRYANDNPLDDNAIMTHKSPKKALDVPAEDVAEQPAPAPAEKPAEDTATAATAPAVPEVTGKPAEPTPAMPANFPEEEEPQAPSNGTAPAVPDSFEESQPAEPTHNEDVALVPEKPAADTPLPDETFEEDEQIASVVNGGQTQPTDEFDLKSEVGSNDGEPTFDPNKAMGKDDVLAATGAPVIDHAFVSHHKGHTKWWEWVAIFLMIILLAVVALNFLIDADIIKTSLDIPHTDLIK